MSHRASEQGLEAFSTGAVRSRTIVYSATKRRVLGLVMAIVLFALWCSAIVLMYGTRRALRAGDPPRSVAAPSR